MEGPVKGIEAEEVREALPAMKKNKGPVKRIEAEVLVFEEKRNNRETSQTGHGNI